MRPTQYAAPHYYEADPRRCPSVRLQAADVRARQFHFRRQRTELLWQHVHAVDLEEILANVDTAALDKVQIARLHERAFLYVYGNCLCQRLCTEQVSEMCLSSCRGPDAALMWVADPPAPDAGLHRTGGP